MRSSVRTLAIGAAVAATCCHLVASAAAAEPYVVTRIDPVGSPARPVGTFQTAAGAINNRAQVLATAHMPPPPSVCTSTPWLCEYETADAIVWDDGVTRALGFNCVPWNYECSGPGEVQPMALNDRGRALAVIYGNNFSWFRHAPADWPRPYPAWTFGDRAGPIDVNDADVTAGTVTAAWADMWSVPFISRDGVSTPLPPLEGWYGTWSDGYIVDAAGKLVADSTRGPRMSGVACALNDGGRVIGQVHDVRGETPTRTVLWEDGRPRDLGTTFEPSCAPGVINDANAVAGSVPREGGGRQAAIWHDGGVDKLSTPAGATSQATFIDDSGQALGWTAVDGKSTDVLWRDGTRIDAAALLPAGSGWTDVRLRALNDRGQIVGGGRLNGQSYGFLLTPPEQATSYRERVLAEPSLLGYWRLGEPGGTEALDAGPLRHARFKNPVTSIAGALAGSPNPAAAFDGVTQQVTVPSLPVVRDFTVEGWTRLRADAGMNLNGNNTLYGAASRVRLIVRPGPPATTTGGYAGVWLGGIEYALQPGTSQTNVDRWVHWAVTRAGPTLTLYRDGVPIARRSDLPADLSVDPTGVIGMQGGWNTYLMRGGIDEVAVYGSALSGATIAAHVAAASAQAASASGSTPR